MNVSIEKAACKESTQHRNAPFGVLTGLLLGLLWSADGTAADDSTAADPGALDIQAALGFSDTIRLGRWAPLTITVQNSGETVDGALEVAVTSGDELEGTVFTNTYQRGLELTRDARKRFHFTVFIDNFAQPIQIRIVSAGNVVAQQAIDLRHRFTEAHLVLVLSRNADLDYLNESASGRVRVSYPHPELLPHQWQGYDGVTALIVHGVTLEQLNPRQYDALKKWLSRGGILIVSGGPDYASLRTARLAELLPATPAGLTTINDDTDFRTALGDSFVAPRPFQVHRVTRISGRATVSAAQDALIIESAVGLGRVTYLAFDIGSYPFEGWTGMAQLWPRLLDLRKPESPRSLPTINTSVVPAIFKESGESFPDRLVVLSFLVAYLGVLGVMYRLVWRSARKKSWTPWMTWMTPLLFAPVAYFLFVSLLFPPGVSATVVSTIEPLPGGPYARVDLDIGIYSNRSDYLRLDVEQATPVFLPRVDPGRPDETEGWVHRDGKPRWLQVADRRPYVLHTLWGTDVTAFDFQAAVVQTETGLSLKVQNNTNRVLESARLVFNGWAYPLGAISAAPSSHYDVSNDNVVAVNNQDEITGKLQGLSVRDRFAIETALRQTVENYRKEAPLLPNEALLIAVLASPRPLLVSSATLQTTEVGLLLSRLPVELLLRGRMDPEPVRRSAQ